MLNTLAGRFVELARGVAYTLTHKDIELEKILDGDALEVMSAPAQTQTALYEVPVYGDGYRSYFGADGHYEGEVLAAPTEMGWKAAAFPYTVYGEKTLTKNAVIRLEETIANPRLRARVKDLICRPQDPMKGGLVTGVTVYSGAGNSYGVGYRIMRYKSTGFSHLTGYAIETKNCFERYDRNGNRLAHFRKVTPRIH